MRRFLNARLRGTVCVTVFAVAALVAAPSALAAKDVRGAAFKFTPTNLFPPTGFAGFSEPSIAVSPKDHLYFCGPNGLTAGNGFIRSADWQTFERFNIKDAGVSGEDCDVKVGPDGAVYEANLQIYGSAIRKSILDGQGPPAAPNTSGNGSFDYQVYEDTVEQDRQWLAPDPNDGSIVYFGYHDIAAEQEIVTKSLDGGKTFPIHVLASNDPLLAPDTGANTYSGPLRVDPADSNTVAIVYGISTAGDNLNACNPDTACFGFAKTVVVAVSTNGGLTFHDVIAMDASKLPGEPILGNIFPWATFDRAGNLYVMAALGGTDANGNATNGVYYAWSADKGTTWSPMIKVNKGAGAVVFPTMVGGKGGVVDFSWLESTQPDQGQNGTWTVHFAQSRNAASAAPTFTEVAGPAVRNGGVCTLGILCNGNRQLGDFFEVALDSFGYAQIAAPATDAANHVYTVYWRQDAGPSATSEPCQPTCVKTRPGPRP
jgi:hypothetical protein